MISCTVCTHSVGCCAHRLMLARTLCNHSVSCCAHRSTTPRTLCTHYVSCCAHRWMLPRTVCAECVSCWTWAVTFEGSKLDGANARRAVPQGSNNANGSYRYNPLQSNNPLRNSVTIVTIRYNALRNVTIRYNALRPTFMGTEKSCLKTARFSSLRQMKDFQAPSPMGLENSRADSVRLC